MLTKTSNNNLMFDKRHLFDKMLYIVIQAFQIVKYTFFFIRKYEMYFLFFRISFIKYYYYNVSLLSIDKLLIELLSVFTLS